MLHLFTLFSDLMKWLKRINENLPVQNMSLSEAILIEAVDCFCISLSHPADRLALTEQICDTIGVAKSKVCIKYHFMAVVFCVLKTGHLCCASQRRLAK